MVCSTFWKYLLFLQDFLFVVMTTDSVSVDDIVAKAIDNGYRNVRFERPCYDTDDQSKLWRHCFLCCHFPRKILPKQHKHWLINFPMLTSYMTLDILFRGFKHDKKCVLFFKHTCMEAYFCHHLSDNCIVTIIMYI